MILIPQELRNMNQLPVMHLFQMSKLLCPLFLWVLSIIIPYSVCAQESGFFLGTEGNKYVSTEIVFDMNSYSPDSSEPLKIGILFTIVPEWHIYWKNSGESGKPTEIKWKLPPGWSADELLWPVPKRTLERGDIQTLAYSKEVLIYSKLYPPQNITDPEPSSLLFEAEISWLVCYDRCVPGKATISKELPVTREPASISDDLIHFQKTQRRVPKSVSQFKSLEERAISILSDTHHLNEGFLYFILPDGMPEKAQFFESSKYPVVRAPLVSLNDLNQLVMSIPFSENDETKTPSGVLAYESKGSKNVFLELPSFSLSDLTLQNGTELVPDSTTFKESTYLTASYKDEDTSLFSGENGTSTTGLLLALLSAFLGGIILNVMPCVLPILSIKLMGIVSAREKSTGKNLQDALWFTAGILSSFVLLAIVAASLQTSGEALGWGFQFQYPGFVISLILVLFILSLGFFDLYIAEIPFLNSLTKLSNKDVLQHDRSKHFFDGVLISALSTPCTAPFLGTALVFAFSQSTFALFLIFISIGLGLAFPYIVVVSRPRLLSYFPKPGEWMNRIKHLMGFGLLATIIWLLKVLERSVEGSSFRTLGILLALYLFFWFWSWSKEQKSIFIKRLTFVIGLSLPLVSWVYLNPLSKHEVSSDQIQWRYYHASELNTEKPVFIDFTAEWCITCKYNENFILTKRSIQNRFKELGVIPLKADWTTGDEDITRALEKFGGKGVPHYVYISGNDKEFHTLPTILTESILLDVLKK
jgi:thiol:disulfide interchange protein/DsbC/DsbD-like thiol-disulfide interchange protein